MNASLKTDTAPGEPHIALRRNNVYFYSTSLFHMAPTHNHIVPLAIFDVLNSKCLLEIYGVTGLKMHSLGFVMINNYPVQHCKIRGRVLLFTEVSYENKDSYFYISMDDYSGIQSTITVRVKCGIVKLVLRENAILEVIGKISFQPNQTQIRASSAEVKGQYSQFELELDWWETVLSTRKFLKIPWRYEPPNQVIEAELTSNQSTEQVRVRFLAPDLMKRKQKRSILIDDSPCPEIPHLSLIPVTDSFDINQPRLPTINSKRIGQPLYIIVSDDEEI